MSKHLLVTFINFLLFSFTGISQIGDEGPFKPEKDTMFAMVNTDGKIVNLPGAPYIRKWWHEKGKYREYLYVSETGKPTRTGWYLDTDCTKKDGLFENYHTNGMMKDSGNYVNNKRKGSYLSWYEPGQEHEKYQYKNNIPVDSCIEARIHNIKS